MNRIPLPIVNELNLYFDSFCKHVTYREGEEFYSKINKVLELSYNENPLGMGKLTLKALSRLARWGYRYPPMNYRVLREAIAKKLDLKKENIIITPGSITAVYLAINQWVNAGEKVVFSKSSLPWYNWIVLSNNSIPIIIPLKGDMNHDLKAILKSIDRKTKAIIISNPHNPTGLYFKDQVIESFFNKIPLNTLLIIDQAYYEYQSNQEKVLPGLIKTNQNLLLTRTFSKLHGMAGLRIGYGIGNPNLIKQLRAKWMAFTPSINAISTYAAYYALKDNNHIKVSRDFNFCVKERIYELADSYNIKYLFSESNFVALNVFDSNRVEKYFIDRGFQLTPGYVFGYPEWIRISFIRNKKVLLEQLKYVFENIKRG